MTSSTDRALVAKKQNLLFNQLTAMPKRFAMVLTVLFTIGVGSMWGETWTWTASAGEDFGSKNGTVTLNGKSWSVSRSSWTQSGTMNNGCLQVGSKNNPTSLTLETSDFLEYNITQIDVVCSSHNGNHNITMSVGSSTFCNATSTPSGDGSKAANVSGSGSAKGAINISFTQKSSSWRAMYIKSITITYEEAASCADPTIAWVTAPADGTVDGNMTAKANTNYPAGLTYSSSDPSVATIDASGVIEYLKVGSTTITASVTGDGTTYCNKTVSVSKTITVACGSKVTINTTSDGNGTITINKTPIETCSDNDGDRQITITLNPNSHYSSNAPTISGITNATITGSGNTYKVQLPKSSNGTLNISATFKEDDKHIVTWSADGHSIKTEEVYVNEQVSVVPTISDIPEENRCGDKFVGWTTDPIATPQDNAPAFFTTVAGSPIITKATTFYAVFADYKQ